MGALISKYFGRPVIFTHTSKKLEIGRSGKHCGLHASYTEIYSTGLVFIEALRYNSEHDQYYDIHIVQRNAVKPYQVFHIMRKTDHDDDKADDDHFSGTDSRDEDQQLIKILPILMKRPKKLLATKHRTWLTNSQPNGVYLPYQDHQRNLNRPSRLQDTGLMQQHRHSEERK